MTTSTPPIAAGNSPADERLVLCVRDALRGYDPIRMWGDSIRITANAGRVVFAGVVRNHSTKETAERIAQQVKGVTAVENRLVVDLDVELAVSEALAADPRTRVLFPGVLVGVVFGIVYLKGEAPSAEVKNAATEVTLKVPGVVSLSNELGTPPELKGMAKPLAADRKAAAVQPPAVKTPA